MLPIILTIMLTLPACIWFGFIPWRTVQPHRNVKAFLQTNDAQFFQCGVQSQPQSCLCTENSKLIPSLHLSIDSRCLLIHPQTISAFSAAISLCWFILSWWSHEITRSFPQVWLPIYHSPHPLFGSWSFEPKGRTCHLSLVNPILNLQAVFLARCFWTTKACSHLSILRR